MGSKNNNVIDDYDFRLFVNCPDCGSKISRSGNTEDQDIICHKCGAVSKVTVYENTVTAELIKPSKRRMKAYMKQLSGSLTTNK